MKGKWKQKVLSIVMSILIVAMMSAPTFANVPAYDIFYVNDLTIGATGGWFFVDRCEKSATAVIIPEYVQSIDARAFSECSNLKTIEIPKGLTGIGDSAFEGCSSLTDVNYTGSEEEWNQIDKGQGNDPLLRATIHYNSTPSPQDPLTNLPFTDVPSYEWYFNDVKQAYQTGLINGFEDNTFRPDENMTYAQAVKLAACMNQKYTTGSVTLSNGSSNWYSSYVEYAKEKGIISKDYAWNTSATRAGYVEIFASALSDAALQEKNSIADNAVPDVHMGHPQASAIYKLYRAGVLAGMDEKGTFAPDSNIRRSEVSAILTRMMNNSARKDLTLNSPFTQKYWVIFTEGYRDNRVEASTVDSILPSEKLYIIWDQKLELNDSSGSGKYDQYYYKDGSEWVKMGDYDRFSANATKIIASNLDVYDKNGNLIIEKSLYKDPNSGNLLTPVNSEENGTISDSWEQIIASINDGTYRSKYSIGNTKELDLGPEGVIEMQIAAFDADELADGSGKAAITWISKDLLNSVYRMNPWLETDPSDSLKYELGTGSIGGWAHSEMRSWLNSDFKQLIPSNVRNCIKSVNKYSASYDTSLNWNKNEVTTDYVWLPSLREVNGTENGYETEGPIYNGLFSSNSDRVKYKAGASNASTWWLRSAGNGGLNFRCIYDSEGDGVIGNTTGDGNGCAAVALGFCL